MQWLSIVQPEKIERHSIGGACNGSPVRWSAVVASEALRTARDWVERTDQSGDALEYAQVQALIAIAQALEEIAERFGRNG